MKPNLVGLLVAVQAENSKFPALR